MTTRIVNERDCSETGDFKFATEASTLGIRPGQDFPEQFETTMGNKLPFVKNEILSDGGYRYVQLLGCIRLTVFND